MDAHESGKTIRADERESECHSFEDVQEGEMHMIILIIRVVIMSENKCSVVMMGLSQHVLHMHSRRSTSGSLLRERERQPLSSSGSSWTLIVFSCCYLLLGTLAVAN